MVHDASNAAARTPAHDGADCSPAVGSGRPWPLRRGTRHAWGRGFRARALHRPPLVRGGLAARPWARGATAADAWGDAAHGRAADGGAASGRSSHGLQRTHAAYAASDADASAGADGPAATGDAYGTHAAAAYEGRVKRKKKPRKQGKKRQPVDYRKDAFAKAVMGAAKY